MNDRSLGARLARLERHLGEDADRYGFSLEQLVLLSYGISPELIGPPATLVTANEASVEELLVGAGTAKLQAEAPT